MNIQFVGSKVAKLSLSELDKNTELDGMEFSVGTAFTKDISNNFVIDFNLKLKIEKNHVLIIQYVSQFETSEDIKDKDQKSHFFSVNAPAIAYPFLRAYVSNFLLSSGYEPLILPTINFVKLSQDNNQKS
jgi:preprotein translocase subunit SecB